MSIWFYSLQFDPAPRAGEPLVSRRPPDYVSYLDDLPITRMLTTSLYPAMQFL
jgi:hypothetical protein